jgi:hypothetical protein
MLTIDVFPASYGDALLVSYGAPDSPSRLLIDGGLTGTAKSVQKRVEVLDAEIDLFVITHIDADHIAGAVRLLDTPSFAERVKAVWFNGRPHLEQFDDLLGALDGERLGERLDALGLPWNEGWPWRIAPGSPPEHAGGPVFIPDRPVRVQLPGGASAVVLSPTKEKLVKLLPVWRTTIRKAGLVDGVAIRRDPPEPPGRVLLGGPTLQELADSPTDDDDSEANGSSIAFVLEVPDGASTRRVLLTGDAHPDVLVAGIDHLRGDADRYRIDLCKLPHHGSRRNVTTEVVALLECSRWIVSTNGKRFNHPNDEAIARILVSNPGSTIYGNYGENRPLDSFLARYPMSRNGYTLSRPRAGHPGSIVSLDDF